MLSSIAYNVQRPVDQERFTDEGKANKVPGCWLILDAHGEGLTEAMENLESLCTHWGWELDLTALS